MRILYSVPPGATPTSGNLVTARRWAAIARGLGHRTSVAPGWKPGRWDLVVALHAWKSRDAIARADAAGIPVVVALTGTDLYRDLGRRAGARDSLSRARRIIALHPEAARRLPRELRARVRTIRQSLERLPRIRRGARSTFDVLVLAHLRPVKDPLLAARAARLLPATSRIRVRLLGRALIPALAAAARREAARNPRFEWLGELPRAQALRLLAGGDLLALTSRMEGGANVIGEALVHGVPVVSTRIDGSTGLLGRGHPGLFPVGDAAALARLLRRAESDPAWLEGLRRRGRRLARAFRPSLERSAWRRLLAEFRGATRIVRG